MCIWCVYSCPNPCNEDNNVCVSGVFPVVLILVMRIPNKFVSGVFPVVTNACNEDTSLCVSSVFPVVLMLVMRIPVSVYLVFFQLS